jgi:hypothetical protein
VIIGIAFALRIHEYKFYLPHVFYSDYIQVDHAAELLQKGVYVDRSSYPHTHVFCYAAADVTAFCLGKLTGARGDWSYFVEQLASKRDPTLRQSIGRAYTAVLGSLLSAAVYWLARARFNRKVALLAAAMIAFAPAHVIYGHQTRIHVPGILALTMAAGCMARGVYLGITPWRAVAIGAACGFTASIFQLGFLGGAAAAALIVLHTRPLARAAYLCVCAGTGFAAVFVGLTEIAHASGLVQHAPGSGALDNAGTLGIPTAALAGFSVGRFLERFPMLLGNWVLAEPFVALGCALFVLQCWQKKFAWRDCVVFGVYPAIVFVALGTSYTEVRYTLSATPFLCIPAAAAILVIGPIPVRAALGALAILVPLATAVRYDALLGRADTRLVLHSKIPALMRCAVTTAIDDSLLLRPVDLAPPISDFPPRGNHKLWPPLGTELPHLTLLRLDAKLYIRARNDQSESIVSTSQLGQHKFRLAGEIPGAPYSRSILPDAPDNLMLTLWRAERPGPTIEFWAQNPAATRCASEITRGEQ